MYLDSLKLSLFDRLSAHNHEGQCKHDPTECEGCLEDHLESLVRSGGWRSIRCPVPSCAATLSVDDVRAFANDETLKLYNEHATRFRIETDPRFTRCCNVGSEGAQCEYGRIHPKSSETAAWTCPKCATMNCFDCKRQGHPGKTCVQHQQSEKTEDKDIETVRKIAKRCPKKGCGEYIQWAKACPDMRCTCFTRFCFECKMIYDTGDSLSTHLKDCSNGKKRGTTRREVERDEVRTIQYAEKWYEDEEYTGPRWSGNYCWVEQTD